MDMIECVSYVAAIGTMALCIAGIYRHARMEGFRDGMDCGAAILLADFCAGNVKVEDGKLVISEEAQFCIKSPDGTRMSELELDKLEFTRTNLFMRTNLP